MVVVVPALAQRQDAEHDVVPALVVALVRPRSPQVADRVDAPGHVVDQENAHQAAPQEARSARRASSREATPRTAGIRSPSTTHSGNRSLTTRSVGLLRRSLA